MKKKEVSTFLLSLVSTLSLLDNKKDIINHLLKGLNDAFEQADFEFCGGHEHNSTCFNFDNGECIVNRSSYLLSSNDFILIQQTINVVSALLEKFECYEDKVNVKTEGVSDSIIKNDSDIRPLQKEKRREKSDSDRLKEGEEVSRLILENSLDAVMLTTPDGKVLSANPATCELFGMSESEIIAAGRRGLVDPDDSRLVPMLEERQRSGKFKGELFFLRKDGTRFEGALSSSVFPNKEGEIRTSIIIRDVTEQKKTQSQLFLFSHALAQSPLSIIITDYQGKIKYTNRSFTFISGFSSDEAEGQNISIVKSGKQPVAFYEDLWNTILSGKDWGGELINRRKNGELYWEYVSISPIKTPKGEITHFVSIREDISGKKKMIDDLVQAKEKAEESDRLKTAFLANISHEIRTPMNGILGFLELLKNPNLQEEEKDTYIDLVNKSGDRLLGTINDLIEISKIESGQVTADYTEVNTQELMAYHLEFFKPAVRKKNLNIKITRQLNSQESLIKTDRLKIDAALSNLISNAIKFTREGIIEFGNYVENDKLVFFVKDTGIGIAEDQIDAVFDRFVQADLNMTKPYQGTGLGLSIIKGYIRLLNGKIWVESVVGNGSVFYFSIPYYPVKI